jgi:hypothetical protein
VQFVVWAETIISDTSATPSTRYLPKNVAKQRQNNVWVMSRENRRATKERTVKLYSSTTSICMKYEPCTVSKIT